MAVDHSPEQAAAICHIAVEKFYTFCWPKRCEESVQKHNVGWCARRRNRNQVSEKFTYFTRAFCAASIKTVGWRLAFGMHHCGRSEVLFVHCGLAATPVKQGNSAMKHSLTLVLAAFALVMAASNASAKLYKGTVIDAPVCDTSGTCAIPPPPGVPQNVGGFLDCSSIHNTDVNGLAGYNYCLWLTNNTGSDLTTFNFSIPFDDSVLTGNNALECSSFTSDVTMTPTKCSLDTANSLFDMTFTASSAVASGTGTVILAMSLNDAPYSDENSGHFGPATVIFGVPTSVPEPGELGLFGLGLLFIGVGYGWEKRRQNRRIRHAA